MADGTRELNIMNRITLDCHSFTSKELLNAAWPQNDRQDFAAWHSGLVLLYNGWAGLKTFNINLDQSSIRQGSEIKIPNDLSNLKITAISIDGRQIYIAFDSKPRKILVWKRNENTPTARLAMPAESGPAQLTEIRDIIIRKDRVAAVTSLGHVATWNQKLLDGASNNDADLLPDWISTKVDSLDLGLEAVIEQISMSQDCERIVVLDPLWCDNTAYITRSPEAVRTIPARKHGKVVESFLGVDEECRLVAVGTIPFGVIDSTTPLITFFAANEDKEQMMLPQFGPRLGANLGDFLDFSIHQTSVIYYGTRGIISINFGEPTDATSSKEIYTCSRKIPLSKECWSGMKYKLETY
jgi:hypothetical protein